jgi:hypothetical protein
MKAHRKNTCLQEIGLHLRDLLSTLSSIVKSIMKVSEKKICIRFRKLHTCTSNNHNQIIGGLNFCLGGDTSCVFGGPTCDGGVFLGGLFTS